MVSALNSGSDGPGSSPGQGCVVFLGKTLYCHGSSLPGVYMGTGEFIAGVTLRWTSIPSRGGVEILLVTSCFGNRDKLQHDGPLGSNADFTLATYSTPRSLFPSLVIASLIFLPS